MQDVHVHFLHGHGGGYTIDFFDQFMASAQAAGLDEIWLLEHTHQFYEFAAVYAPVRAGSGRFRLKPSPLPSPRSCAWPAKYG